MFVKFAAVPFVFPDVLVDPLMAYLDAKILQHPVRHLFWTKVLSQISFNFMPIFSRYSPFRLLPTVFSKSLGLFMTITSLSSISLQLSADCRFMNANFFCYFRLVVTSIQKYFNLVPFKRGKRSKT
jgi:hypothetical protein